MSGRDWRKIPLPKKMRALARDSRGYPIPFIVFRDNDGAPHFSINEDTRRARCLTERRCPICGTVLDRELWFTGGPLSAFHEHGSYNDTAMHHECMTYAMQVCPYLAVGRYQNRIDLGNLDLDKVSEHRIFQDPTTIPDRPVLFVSVMSYAQQISKSGHVRPARPYQKIEYWQNGEMLSVTEGRELSRQALEAAER